MLSVQILADIERERIVSGRQLDGVSPARLTGVVQRALTVGGLDAAMIVLAVARAARWVGDDYIATVNLLSVARSLSAHTEPGAVAAVRVALRALVDEGVVGAAVPANPSALFDVRLPVGVERPN